MSSPSIRDLFRGDYVILSYRFSRIPPGGIPGLNPSYDRADMAAQQNQPVYVSLVPEADGIHYKTGQISLNRPQSGKFIRGKVVDWNRLEFGIEKYFLQEGTGHDYEEAVRSRRLWAEVAVAPDGTAALKGLRIEDTATTFTADDVNIPIPMRDVTAVQPRPTIEQEFEYLSVVEKVGCETSVQSMNAWNGQRWGNGQQLFCRGKQGARVTVRFDVYRAGQYKILVRATYAPDYGIVQAKLDDKPMGKPFDGYATEVLPPGNFALGQVELQPGPHKLSFEFVGKNEASTGYNCGLDHLMVQPVEPPDTKKK